MIMNVCTGSASLMASSVTSDNGFETWRRFTQRYSPPCKARSMGALTSILEVHFPEHNFEEYFAYWENEIAKFETSTSSARAEEGRIATCSARHPELFNNIFV